MFLHALTLTCRENRMINNCHVTVKCAILIELPLPGTIQIEFRSPVDLLMTFTTGLLSGRCDGIQSARVFPAVGSIRRTCEYDCKIYFSLSVGASLRKMLAWINIVFPP